MTGRARTAGAARELVFAMATATVAGASTAALAQEKSSDPYSQPDRSRISIAGTIGSVTSQAFTLDYGDARINVELDDVDPDSETQALRSGDRVVVTGRIDDDFFDAARIEASSVYVERLGTQFFASDADEEGMNIVTVTPVSVSTATLRGVVTDVGDGEFTLDSGPRSVTVDVASLANDPLDESGYQRIEVGDTVAVHGEIDEAFLQERQLEATVVTTLIEGVG